MLLISAPTPYAHGWFQALSQRRYLPRDALGPPLGPSTQWLALSLAISVLIASSVTASSLTPDFRVHRARLGAFARARLPNISDINRKAALTRWRRYREGQAATKASESRTSSH